MWIGFYRSDVELLDESVEELQLISEILSDVEQLFILPQGVGKSSLATLLISARERLLKMLLEYGHWKRWTGPDPEEAHRRNIHVNLY